MSALLDWIFPRHTTCCLCGKEACTDERRICAVCADALKVPQDIDCPPALDGLTCGAYYDDITSNAVQKLKYEDARYLGEFFAGLISIPEAWSIDMIMPIPLYRARFIKRGYNQSELIARALERRTGLPLDTASLTRIRDTGTQTSLTARERVSNMQGAFRAQSAVRGKSILIVDDVFTTGSTISEAALTLKKAGASAVYGATACLTRVHDKV